MPDLGFPVPPPPAFPFSQRVGKGFSQQEYDEAGQPLIQKAIPFGLAAGLAGLGGPAGVSVPQALFDLFTSQLPANQGGVLAAAARPQTIVPLLSRQLEQKLQRSLTGSMILPSGEVQPLEWLASHASGTNLAKALERGGVRVRSDGIQIHGLETADPRNLQRALEDVANRNKTVYVETKHANLQFDADQIRNNNFSLKGLQPIQFWLKGEY